MQGPNSTVQLFPIALQKLEAHSIIALANTGFALTQLILQPDLTQNATLGLQMLTTNVTLKCSTGNITLPAIILSVSPCQCSVCKYGEGSFCLFSAPAAAGSPPMSNSANTSVEAKPQHTSKTSSQSNHGAENVINSQKPNNKTCKNMAEIDGGH